MINPGSGSNSFVSGSDSFLLVTYNGPNKPVKTPPPLLINQLNTFNSSKETIDAKDKKEKTESFINKLRKAIPKKVKDLSSRFKARHQKTEKNNAGKSKPNVDHYSVVKSNEVFKITEKKRDVTDSGDTKSAFPSSISYNLEAETLEIEEELGEDNKGESGGLQTPPVSWLKGNVSSLLKTEDSDQSGSEFEEGPNQLDNRTEGGRSSKQIGNSEQIGNYDNSGDEYGNSGYESEEGPNQLDNRTEGGRSSKQIGNSEQIGNYDNSGDEYDNSGDESGEGPNQLDNRTEGGRSSEQIGDYDQSGYGYKIGQTHEDIINGSIPRKIYRPMTLYVCSHEVLSSELTPQLSTERKWNDQQISDYLSQAIDYVKKQQFDLQGHLAEAIESGEGKKTILTKDDVSGQLRPLTAEEVVERANVLQAKKQRTLTETESNLLNNETVLYFKPSGTNKEDVKIYLKIKTFVGGFNKDETALYAQMAFSAIKELNKLDNSVKQRVLQTLTPKSKEIQIHKELKDLKKDGADLSQVLICKSVSSVDVGGSIQEGLLTPPCDGNVNELMKTNKDSLSEPLQRSKVAAFIAKGVAQLHQANFVHRDLKLDNFLYLMDPETFEISNVQIGDLGLAVKADSLPSRDPERFILSNVDPDWLLGPNNLSSKESDIYQLGISLLCILSGNTQDDFIDMLAEEMGGPLNLKEIFRDDQKRDQFIYFKSHAENWEWVKKFPEGATKQIIIEMLSANSIDRPSALTVANFFTGYYNYEKNL